MKNLITTISFFLVALSFTNCATVLSSKLKPVKIVSNPLGADVYINNKRVGVTPIKLKLKANRRETNYDVTIRKEGYKEVNRRIGAKLSAGWLVVDLLSGAFPMIIDGLTGNWKRLDKKKINVDLDKKETKSTVNTNKLETKIN